MSGDVGQRRFIVIHVQGTTYVQMSEFAEGSCKCQERDTAFVNGLVHVAAKYNQSSSRLGYVKRVG